MASDEELSIPRRMVSAGTGSVVTSLLVTPFDVVKIRLQSQAAFPPSSSSSATAPKHKLCDIPPSCNYYQANTGPVDTWCPKCGPANAVSNGTIGNPRAVSRAFTGSVDAAVKIWKFEGVSALWRGLSQSMLISIPSTVVYFSMYDELRLRMKRHYPNMAPWAPLFSGVAARAVTTIVVSPIELIRTQRMAQTNAERIPALDMVRKEVERFGARGLWRGAGATLWRDIPFSAIYWMTLERLRERLVHWDMFRIKPNTTPSWVDGYNNNSSNSNSSNSSSGHHNSNYVRVTFVSGALSGALAATLTHPLDLVKTRRQVEVFKLDPSLPLTKGNSWTLVLRIYREEGFRALFTGWAPRVARIGPACAVMIASYEWAKMSLRGTPSPSPSPSTSTSTSTSASMTE